jgi:hypothetical protein
MPPEKFMLNVPKEMAALLEATVGCPFPESVTASALDGDVM